MVITSFKRSLGEFFACCLGRRAKFDNIFLKIRIVLGACSSLLFGGAYYKFQESHVQSARCVAIIP